jgi:hypothetical protein
MKTPAVRVVDDRAFQFIEAYPGHLKDSIFPVRHSGGSLVL